MRIIILVKNGMEMTIQVLRQKTRNGQMLLKTVHLL